MPVPSTGILHAMSRVARIFSTVLITAGLVVMADVGLTLAYKEPISSIYGEIKQHAAANQLADLESRYPTRADLAAIAGVRGVDRKANVLARRFADQAKTGEAIGRIIVPAMGLNAVFIQGTDTGSLQKGPGHYPDTPFPGEGGTVGIAGHRTTYLAPFRHIDSMHKGDRITLEMPYGTFTYRVQKSEIVDPSDVQIVHKVGYERLVLTACHPLYSASQRYAIFARLSDTAIFDAARGLPYQAN
ncbi:MAG TPA: class E sortase [Solirubrobacterales bacterium]